MKTSKHRNLRNAHTHTSHHLISVREGGMEEGMKTCAASTAAHVRSPDVPSAKLGLRATSIDFQPLNLRIQKEGCGAQDSDPMKGTVPGPTYKICV